MSILLVITGFIAAIIAGEIVQGNGKIQAAIVKVFLVHLITAFILYWLFFFIDGISFPALMIFWAGAFLSWFGIRSHIESSILLKMLVLIKANGSLNHGILLSIYDRHYGPEKRIKEMMHSGLIKEHEGKINLQSKGKYIRTFFKTITYTWRL